jgi:EAL domain-containing protein (putative c-di-GMP-specific phosphodiesterase class I)
VGLEALIRWPTPEGGRVPLGEFLPVAERSNLITHVGWWTMEAACRQLLEWHARYPTDPPEGVMVNIPGRQFSEPELVASVLSILEETGLEGQHLHLEITETSAMSNLERSVDTLRNLKGAGVHVHVDDFGTGYSSLSYIHRFPVAARDRPGSGMRVRPGMVVRQGHGRRRSGEDPGVARLHPGSTQERGRRASLFNRLRELAL